MNNQQSGHGKELQGRTAYGSAASGWWARLTEYRAAPGARAVAARAGVALGLPLFVLATTDATDLAIYATFGAFTAVYGRGAPRRLRVRTQMQAGTWLTVCVLVGVAIGTLPSRNWWEIPVAALVATFGSLLASRWQWRPTGPLFAVFAVAACASTTTSSDRIGQATVVTGATAALAVVLGLIGGTVRGPPPNAGGSNTPATVTLPPRRDVTDAARHAVAATAAGVLATAAGWGHPDWAMATAVAVTAGSDRGGRMVRGVQRIAGTLVGVGATAVLLAPHPSTAVILAVAVAAQVLTELTIGRNYAVALIFITPLGLLMAQLGRSQDVSVLLRDRALETVVGGLIGIAVASVKLPLGRAVGPGLMGVAS